MKKLVSVSTKLLSSRRFHLGLGIGVSIACLYLAVQNVDYRGLWLALSQADIGFIGLALISVVLNTLSKAARWRSLMGEPGRKIAPRPILGTLLIGQLLNSLVPARIGDVSRAYIIGGMGPGRTFVFGTVALEKILDMTLYTILFLLLVLLMPVPAWLSQPAYPFAVIALSAFLATLLLTYRQTWLLRTFTWITGMLPGKVRTRLLAMANNGIASLSILQDHKNNLKVGFWCALIWGTAVLTNYLVMRALAIDAPSISSLFVLIVLQAGISIPSVPGRIGVFEYLCVLSLGVFAIDSTTALSYGLLLHAVVFLPPTIAGMLFLWGSGLNLRQPMPAGVDSDLASTPLLNGER